MADEAEHFQSSPLKRPRLDFEHHNGFGHNPSNTQNLISPNNMIHAGGDGQMDTRGTCSPSTGSPSEFSSSFFSYQPSNPNDGGVQNYESQSGSDSGFCGGTMFSGGDNSFNNSDSGEGSSADGVSGDDAGDDDNVSEISNLSGLSEEEWRPTSGPMSWVQSQMEMGKNPRTILSELMPQGTLIPDDFDSFTLWKIIINILAEPPKREKLDHVNTFEDVIMLLKTCRNIMVLTGAGVSVSCGIPDFRSKDGVYARLAVEYPDLPDPQAMFDIRYFEKNPKPFFKFAKEIYPGQFAPSPCHQFIKKIEEHGTLLRNYTQNIDTLEQVAGIENVIQCHGSFATASCRACKYKVAAETIRDDIMNQVIPMCPVCGPDHHPMGILKPDIVFFGESLSEEFHKQMAEDKNKCDLLIVIGSSLKVRPVALIPSSLPPNVPQVLINREPLKHLNFDVELLGDCDVIVNEICHRLGCSWKSICASSEPAVQTTVDALLTPPASRPGSASFLQSLQGGSTSSLSSLEPSLPPRSSTDLATSQITQAANTTTPTFSHGNSLAAEPEKTERVTSQIKDIATNTNSLSTDNSLLSDSKQGGLAISETAGVGNDTPNLSMETSLPPQTDSVVPENKETLSQGIPSEAPFINNRQSNPEELQTNQVGVDLVGVNKTNESDSQSDPANDSKAETVTPTRSLSRQGSCDDITPESEHDIEALRACWIPRHRQSIAKRLPDNSFLFVAPSRYVFKGAEVDIDDDEEDEEEEEEEDDDDDEEEEICGSSHNDSFAAGDAEVKPFESTSHASLESQATSVHGLDTNAAPQQDLQPPSQTSGSDQAVRNCEPSIPLASPVQNTP